MKRVLHFAIFGLLAAGISPAERADEPSRYYFDHGAEQFTRDDLEKARAWVDEGLQLYPEDVKLILLKRLLEPPPQQQPNQQQQSQPQSNPQSSPEQQQQQQQDQSDEQQQAGAEEQQQENQGQTPSATQMSEEEAKRILDALKDREASERARAAADRLRREMSRLPPVEKDW